MTELFHERIREQGHRILLRERKCWVSSLMFHDSVQKEKILDQIMRRLSRGKEWFLTDFMTMELHLQVQLLNMRNIPIQMTSISRPLNIIQTVQQHEPLCSM